MWRRAGLFVLLVILSLSLGCTYFWRKEYRLSDDAGSTTANGWIITPKIISPAVCSDLKAPVSLPSMFAIAFRATRPRPLPEETGSAPTITDLVIDSALLQFRRTETRLDLHFNEAIWVSHAAISPDSLIKTFRVVDKLGDLIWVDLPTGDDTLEIRLFTTTHRGELAAQRRFDRDAAPFDTAFWRPLGVPPVHPRPLILQMECRDIMMMLPGFRNCD